MGSSSDVAGKPAWQKWAFAVVPAVGLLELGLHLAQVSGGLSDSDWQKARELVKARAQPDDLVLVAPRWLDPLGRQHLGADILTVEREARPDETGFPRAIQVSLGGARAPELASWKQTAKEAAGRFTITTYENPSPVRVIDRLLSHDGPSGMHVATITAGRESECTWSVGAAQAGSLGFGPAVPGAKFACPGGGFVGVSIIANLDYTPRRCFYAPVTSGSTSIAIQFKNVAFGRTLHGHHGLYVEAERSLTGRPVTLTFSVDGNRIGTVVHNDGQGWAGFDFPTDAIEGQHKDLLAEISSQDGNRRTYCFEADTR